MEKITAGRVIAGIFVTLYTSFSLLVYSSPLPGSLKAAGMLAALGVAVIIGASTFFEEERSDAMAMIGTGCLHSAFLFATSFVVEVSPIGHSLLPVVLKCTAGAAFLFWVYRAWRNTIKEKVWVAEETVQTL